MINSLYIENLKCFEKLKLPTPPLTLLTGFNAAGKSTATQGLLLLAQSLRQGATKKRIPLNGPLVKLGSPGDVLGESSTPTLSLGISSGDNKVSWTFGPDADRTGHVLSLDSHSWATHSTSGKWTGSESLRPTGLCGEAAPEEINTLVNQLKEIVYISAVRSVATELFPSPDAPDPVWADVGTTGEYAAWWFAERLDEDIEVSRAYPSEQALTLRRQFNAWAGELFPGAEANAQRIPGSSFVKLELRNHNTDTWRRPANIGYGYTYAFPIILAGLLAKKGQILIIDSPEAHLHPMAQSKIGKFLATVAATGVQVIVETHSDHLLNGVRLAVRGQFIAPESVGVHFFNARPRSTNDPAHVVALNVDGQGNLSEWPKGFFDQAENDLAVLAGWMPQAN
ncbi:DUF3696 domain-containing protein [Pseudomonas juntendi]|uniref:DUF3696 domain-containing protein n=1 Tax=Pseudomonas juntendi TaxID=2666183 RepID=A0A7W2KH15_9PSED|nr:DUF3696 domain-containing protein [Pseudomonas juntendi]MBA6098373.1 DUF3696 domain-containing protein [Pseudomonas juntendi]